MNLHRRVFHFVKTFCRRFGYAPKRLVILRAFADEDAMELETCLNQLERGGFLATAGDEDQTELRRTDVPHLKMRIPVRSRRAANILSVKSGLDSGAIILNLDGVGISSPEEVYAIQVSDDSMVGAGLRQGDFAIIANQAGPCSGDIAAVRLEGECVLRRYVLIARIPHLLAEHPTRPELIPAYDAQFEGVLWASLQIDPSHRRINDSKKPRVIYSEREGLKPGAFFRPIAASSRKSPVNYVARMVRPSAFPPNSHAGRRPANDAENLYQKTSLVDPGDGLPKYGVNERLTDSPSAGGYRLPKKSAKKQPRTARRRKTAPRRSQGK